MQPGQVVKLGEIPQGSTIIFRMRDPRVHEEHLMFTRFAAGATGVEKNGNGWKALTFTFCCSGEEQVEVVEVLDKPLESPWKFLNSA